jgi:hypothetical protein
LRLFVAVLLIGQAVAYGQTATPSAIDVQRLGPQVGQHVPEFTLRDQFGRTHTLSSLMGPKGMMLVFFRSADW